MKRTVETKYFTLNQNNAGGRWDLTGKANAHVVIVEALDSNDAMRRANELGLDLDCCNDFSGRRWPTGEYFDNDGIGEESGPLVERAMAGNEHIRDLVASVCHLDGTVEIHERIQGHVRGLTPAEVKALLVQSIPEKSREVRITQQKTLADKIARANQKSEAEKLKKRIDWLRQKEADIRSGAIFEAATPDSIRKEMEAISETYREKPKKQNKKSDDVPAAEWKPGKRRIVID